MESLRLFLERLAPGELERHVKRALVLAAFGACAAPLAQAPASLEVESTPTTTIGSAPPTAPGKLAPEAAPASPAEPGLADEEVDTLLTMNCGACHSLAYVRQQRMSAGQWTATLTKMRNWGAQLEEPQVGALATALAGRYGPGRTLPEPRLEDVAPFAAPKAPHQSPPAIARGKQLYAARCLPCHGPDARGGIGVNLGDEQLLQEPTRFSATVRSGRGRMPPHPDLTDAQLRDLLAWLVTL